MRLQNIILDNTLSYTERLGLTKSYVIYFRPGLKQRMKSFYSQFIKPGDIAFDIGSHLGNRIHPWVELGAKVHAFEPQSYLYELLKKSWGHEKNVTIYPWVISGINDDIDFYVSDANPTLATCEKNWIQKSKVDHRFLNVKWNRIVKKKSVDFDYLIKEIGVPKFVKIDVEGAELAVIKTLNHAIENISFEFIPFNKQDTLDCVTHISTLADYEYNFSYTESMRFQYRKWMTHSEVLRFIIAQNLHSNSGDIYARRVKKASL